MRWSHVAVWPLASVLVAPAFVVGAVPAMGQELEPRSYSASPIDTNFAVGVFSSSTGTVPVDPSLPVSDVRPAINTASVSYTRTFRLGSRTANWALMLPYVGGHLTAAVYGREQAFSRFGFSDLRARFGVNLLGRALTPAEFARRRPGTTLGASLTLMVPTGTYDRTQFINTGSNRWTLKPELGMEQPMGKWFTDFSAGLWLFGTNSDYVAGRTLRQAPLGILQVHAGYNLRPGQWLAADANYYAGGATSVDGAAAVNRLANSRYGLTFSQPMGTGLSVKVAWSHWLKGTYGQKFATVGAALQYLWFDRH